MHNFINVSVAVNESFIKPSNGFRPAVIDCHFAFFLDVHHPLSKIGDLLYQSIHLHLMPTVSCHTFPVLPSIVRSHWQF
jgi:hypothetical protein